MLRTPLAAACAFESGHLTLLSGAGEGEVVSKEAGEEERGAQVVVYYCRTLYESCARGGVKRGDVCYGMLRAAACVDELEWVCLHNCVGSVERVRRRNTLDRGLVELRFEARVFLEHLLNVR